MGTMAVDDPIAGRGPSLLLVAADIMRKALDPGASRRTVSARGRMT
ncbi:hypothetical protein [Sphingobium chungangianum]